MLQLSIGDGFADIIVENMENINGFLKKSIEGTDFVLLIYWIIVF